MSLGGASRAPLWIVLTAALALFLATGTAAAQDSGSPIEVLGDGPIEVSVEEGKDTVETALTVLNTSKSPVEVRVTFEAAAEDTAVEVESFKPDTIEGQDAERIELTLSGVDTLEEDAAGELVVDSADSAAARSVTIAPAPQPERDWATWILGTALFMVVLMILVVLGTNKMGDLKLLKKRAPGQEWSFGDSWATTLTAAGALFGAVLGDVTLPEAPMEIDKETLIRLNVLFGAVLVIAPFIFSAIRPWELSDEDEKAGLVSFNGVLLFSTCLVFGAVTGELFTLGLLCWELLGGGADAGAAIVVVVLLWGLAFWYFLVTTRKLVKTDWEAKPPAAAKAKGTTIAVAEVRSERLRVPMP